MPLLLFRQDVLQRESDLTAGHGVLRYTGIHVEARSTLAALDVTVFLPEVPRSGFTMPKESFLGAGLGLVQRIENRVSGIPALLDHAREDLEEAEQTVADTPQRLGQPFRRAQALADALASSPSSP